MASKQFVRQYRLVAFICTLVAFSSVSLLYWNNSLQWTENLFYDLHVKWRGENATSGNIVLILMDEKSAVELKRSRGTWPRSKLDLALQHLCAAEAEIIGLDMILSVPDSSPAIDQSLAQTIYNCNNVILARISASKGKGEIPPLPIFQEGMIGDGFIDVFPDEDEILRRTRFLNAKRMDDGGLMLLPSFPLEIARSFLNLEFEFDFSPKDHFLIGAKDDKQLRLPDPELLINYTGNYKNYTNISYADVVNNRFSPKLVKGKIVLVGSSLPLEKDFYATPYSRFQKTALLFEEKFATVLENTQQQKDLGVSSHAYAIESILSQKFIRQIDKKLIITLTALTALLGLLFFLTKVNSLWCTSILLLFMLIIFGGAHFSFVRHLVWADISPMLFILPIQFISGIAVQRYFEKKKSEQVTNLFGRYVSPAVVNQLISDDISNTLSGQRQEVTIFFSDIRSFTTMSEKLGAKDTGILLNTYFDRMIPIIFEHDGTLDKLIGDAIMAFYGAPVELPDHPDKAAAAALIMLDVLAELKKLDINGIENIDIGCGLNTGEVTIGNLGSEKFMDYTVIGDAVNLAARLEGINKTYGTKIIVSEFTAKRLSEKFSLRKLDTVIVKGKDKAVTIYELAGFSKIISDDRKKMIALFEDALGLYKKMNWDEAEKTFKKVLETFPEDNPSKLYLDRIKKMRLSPPPDGWDGSTKFDTK